MTQVKPTIAGFARFVNSKPADERFKWSDPRKCAIAQYAESLGLKYGKCGLALTREMEHAREGDRTTLCGFDIKVNFPLRNENMDSDHYGTIAFGAVLLRLIHLGLVQPEDLAEVQVGPKPEDVAKNMGDDGALAEA